MSRVVIRGQVAPSIVHKVNQAISASVVNGKAGLRGLAEAESTPRVEKTREALCRMIPDGERAAYVIRIASYRPEARSRAVRLLVECRGRDW
jgi:hypothetical protein